MELLKRGDIYNVSKIAEIKNNLASDECAVVRTDNKEFTIYNGAFAVGFSYNPAALISRNKTSSAFVKSHVKASNGAMYQIYKID